MKTNILHRLILLAACVAALAALVPAQNKKEVLTLKTFGAARVGMTVAEASKALGVRLVTNDANEECRYYEAKTGFKDIAFMTSNDRIVRFDIRKRGYATDRGVRVGDTEARVRRLYRGLYKVEKHHYIDGHYITITTKDGKFGLVFETDGRRVISINAGRAPEYGYIEGCS
ncbi:MAG: hypothetical protein JSS81_14790 [Acidobacteria bacterium]|nr:hypothetical protein [Acidobacteriota bacterium]